jgi:hypothetical protein
MQFIVRTPISATQYYIFVTMSGCLKFHCYIIEADEVVLYSFGLELLSPKFGFKASIYKLRYS